jgi:tRNA(Ile2) C34 agmatinyltransferase TiaS
MRPLRQLHPRLRRGRNARAIRVAAISIDQLVPCPNCGEPMRLFDAQTFVCKQCGRAVDMKGILKSLDVGE